jgi:Txe/YoeB family toxin of Txe-Axe toxin-antitoxin module
VQTQSFLKDVKKEVKKNPSLKNKIAIALQKVQSNPFQGRKIQNPSLPEWRIYIGDSHRLFYDLDGNKIVLLKLLPKSKTTYQ